MIDGVWLMVDDFWLVVMVFMAQNTGFGVLEVEASTGAKVMLSKLLQELQD